VWGPRGLQRAKVQLQTSQEAQQISDQCQEMTTSDCICVKAQCTEKFVNIHYLHTNATQSKADLFERTNYATHKIGVFIVLDDCDDKLEQILYRNFQDLSSISCHY
jgi:hypothetical protein